MDQAQASGACRGQVFELTPKQQEANELLAGLATHTLLYGGSRSGKTALLVRAIVMRGLKARNTRHAILRFRFNAVKESIGMDTLPKVMRECFPSIPYKLNQSDWYLSLPTGSEVWLGGLDDKERTEKVLGKEYATILLNECSQIPYSARNMALTRLAQNGINDLPGREPLPLRMYYDINPVAKTHWTYRMFRQKLDPESKRALMDASMYQSLQMNPMDNQANLPPAYLSELRSLPARLQRRFWEGEYSDLSEHALFREEDIDKWRVLDGRVPDFSRVVVAVDPSGSGDIDNADNDAIGICVVALGTDGNGYVLEDLTVKAGPATWGRIATDAYDRHRADRVVGEVNYGGEMVRHVIQTARPRTPYTAVTATRGKAVRAEPIASLVETGKVRFIGYFPELEEELSGFSTAGYTGDGSPNRADAFVWGMTALFPGMTKAPVVQSKPKYQHVRYIEDGGDGRSDSGWMGN